MNQTEFNNILNNDIRKAEHSLLSFLPDARDGQDEVVRAMEYSLSNGGVLCVTSFLYNPPYSENYDKKGISPDVEVELPDEFKNTSLFFLSHEDDTQLGRALEEIKK